MKSKKPKTQKPVVTRDLNYVTSAKRIEKERIEKERKLNPCAPQHKSF